MKRKDSQFGLHFDMHARDFSTSIGENFDSNLIEEICKNVKPDYIQVDTKGHPGYSSYPTKVGKQAPEIKNDILKVWREITKKYGILLIAHYSGVIDEYQATNHKEWAIVNANGEFSKDKTSIFSEYSKNILIPQLIELALDYELDGAWIDGDCTGIVADYSENAKLAYGKRIPKPNKKGYRKYQDFLRKEFLKYVQNYINEVKKVAPNFEITSNWINSPCVPEESNVVEFISGDLCPVSSIIFSRFYARMLAAFNINWDIMSWGFSVPTYYVKPTTQICQEAASILMLGGGYQVYNIQKAKGTILHDWIVPSLVETANFCRERKFCHNSKSIAEVGVLYSKEAAYYKKDTIFGSGGNYNIDMRDLTSALLDNQLSVQVILSSAKNLKRFSIIVLPDCGDIEKSIKNRLLQYVKGGGTVILTGTRTLELFKNELLIKNIKTVTSKPSILIRGGNSRNIVNKNYSIVEGDFNTLNVFNVLDIEHPIDREYQTQIAGHEVENQQEERQIIGKEYPSVIESNIGKGKLIAITFDYGLAYGSERSSELKNLIQDITKTIPKKLNVKSSSYLEVDLQTNNDKTYIHLLNAGGEHRASLVKAFDEIPPLYHIEVEYKCKKQPKFVRLLPENINLPFTYSNKTLKTFVEKIEIHSAIEITF